MNGHIHILALHGVDLPCVVQLFILIHALILRMLFHCASWTQRPAPGCIQRGEQQLLASTINSSVTFGFPNIKAILCTWSKRSKKGTCCQVQCFLTETLSWIDSFDSFDSCFRVVYGQTQILWAWVYLNSERRPHLPVECESMWIGQPVSLVVTHPGDKVRADLEIVVSRPEMADL